MGTVPMEENVRVACSDGRVVWISSDTTTSDLSMGSEGTAGVYCRMDDGGEFGFAVPLDIYDDKWFRRLCDAIAADAKFRASLADVEIVDDSFAIPSAPNRDGGAAARLARKGGKAKFKDYAALRSGRDRFSGMKLPELEASVGDQARSDVRSKMAFVPEGERDTEIAKALRWLLRGLPIDMAVRKVAVDREISSSAGKSTKRR